MSGSERLSYELDAGYFASVHEVIDANIKGAEIGTYFEDLERDYSYERVRRDIDEDSRDQSPEVFSVVGNGSPLSDDEAAELTAAEDRVRKIQADKDAIQAEIEAAVLMARIDRYMSAVTGGVNLTQSSVSVKEGEA